MSASSERLSRLIALQEESRTKRAELNDKREALIRVAKDERGDDADLNEKEDAEFREHSESIKTVDAEIIARDERITDLAEEEKRSKNASDAVRRAGLIENEIRVTSESLTYEKSNQRASYFKDLALASVNRDQAAQERLNRHAIEVEMEARTNPNRTDGQGGHYEVAAA